MQPLGKRVEDERYGVARTLCGQSWLCEGCAIPPNMLGEESSLSTVLGAQQPANCVCVSRAEAARLVDAVLSSPLTFQRVPGDANRSSKIHRSAVPNERC